MPFISPTREAFTEKFYALLDECDHVADNALFGKTFNDLEEFFLITKLRKLRKERFPNLERDFAKMKHDP